MSRSIKDNRNYIRKAAWHAKRKGLITSEEFVHFWKIECHATLHCRRNQPTSAINGSQIGCIIWDREDWKHVKKIHHRSVRRRWRIDLKISAG